MDRKRWWLQTKVWSERQWTMQTTQHFFRDVEFIDNSYIIHGKVAERCTSEHLLTWLQILLIFSNPFFYFVSHFWRNFCYILLTHRTVVAWLRIRSVVVKRYELYCCTHVSPTSVHQHVTTKVHRFDKSGIYAQRSNSLNVRTTDFYFSSWHIVFGRGHGSISAWVTCSQLCGMCLILSLLWLSNAIKVQA